MSTFVNSRRRNEGDSVPQGGVENLREEDAERPESGEVALDARDVSHGFAQAEVDFHFDILCGNGVIVALSRRDEEGGGKAGIPRHSKKVGRRETQHPAHLKRAVAKNVDAVLGESLEDGMDSGDEIAVVLGFESMDDVLAAEGRGGGGVSDEFGRENGGGKGRRKGRRTRSQPAGTPPGSRSEANSTPMTCD